MISVAVIGITSWVWDPSWVPYALEQPEMLRDVLNWKKIVKLNIKLIMSSLRIDFEKGGISIWID